MKSIFNNFICISLILSIVIVTSVSSQKKCKCCNTSQKKSVTVQCCSNTENRQTCCSEKDVSGKECEGKCNCNSLCSSKDLNNTAKIENSEISFDYLQKFLTLIYSFKIILIKNNLEYSLVLTNRLDPLKLPLVVPLRV